MFIGGRKGKKGIRNSSRGGHIYSLSSSLKPDRALSLSLACVLLLVSVVIHFIFQLSYFITETKVVIVIFLMLFLSQDICLSLILLLTFLCFASSVHCVKQLHFLQKFQPILLSLFFFPVNNAISGCFEVHTNCSPFLSLKLIEPGNIQIAILGLSY